MARSIRTTFRFEGGQEIAAKLQELSRAISRSVTRRALEGAAEPMARRMRGLAPWAPGAPDLRNTIGIGQSRGDADPADVSVAVGPALAGYYGSFQELGTSRHPAQPFARPAFDQTTPICLRELGDRFWMELAGRGVHRPSVSAPSGLSGGLI